METHRSVKIVLTVSYVLQIASSTVYSHTELFTALILHTYVQNLVHILVFVKDLVLVFI